MLNKAIIGLSVLLTALCGVALAENPPGFNWGGFNCGCNNNLAATLQSCHLCCDAATQSQAITAEQGIGCRAFCDQAAFPCLPRGGNGEGD